MQIGPIVSCYYGFLDKNIPKYVVYLNDTSNPDFETNSKFQLKVWLNLNGLRIGNIFKVFPDGYEIEFHLIPL